MANNINNPYTIEIDNLYTIEIDNPSAIDVDKNETWVSNNRLVKNVDITIEVITGKVNISLQKLENGNWTIVNQKKDITKKATLNYRGVRVPLQLLVKGLDSTNQFNVYSNVWNV